MCLFFCVQKKKKEIGNKNVKNKRKNTLNDTTTETLRMAVSDPLKLYFNPLEHILEDTKVVNGLEYFLTFSHWELKH